MTKDSQNGCSHTWLFQFKITNTSFQIMNINEIFSLIGGTSQPVPPIQQSNSEFYEWLKSLQCGDTVASIFPSVIYLVGIALLIHHIITMNIRPQLYRRVGRELLLQVPWQVSVFVFFCPTILNILLD